MTTTPKPRKRRRTRVAVHLPDDTTLGEVPTGGELLLEFVRAAAPTIAAAIFTRPAAPPEPSDAELRLIPKGVSVARCASPTEANLYELRFWFRDRADICILVDAGDISAIGNAGGLQ